LNTAHHNATKLIRVIVVDDSALVRALLAELINAQPDMACVAMAGDAFEARELIRTLDPDVITLDVEMPHMDGIEFLSRLMRLRPTPVVMVSTMTQRGAATTLRALELGAVDFVSKPRMNQRESIPTLAWELTQKIRVAAKARVKRLLAASLPISLEALERKLPSASGHQAASLAAQGHVIFIGASTGGTEATRALLEALPLECPPIVIAQHMPAGFTQSYAQRLDAVLPHTVQEARDGMLLAPQHIYVAPGGLHTSVQRQPRLCLRVADGEPVNRHKPSVEVLFRSAARVVGAKALGVMLTGMGADGARAMREMRDAGAYNLCQDEDSCVVFGMPREAIAAGAAHDVMAPPDIARRLAERLRR
jgi:two-component system, chemotaxis family, protein-glutamate methylesterase/glutaminase